MFIEELLYTFRPQRHCIRQERGNDEDKRSLGKLDRECGSASLAHRSYSTSLRPQALEKRSTSFAALPNGCNCQLHDALLHRCTLLACHLRGSPSTPVCPFLLF